MTCLNIICRRCQTEDSRARWGFLPPANLCLNQLRDAQSTNKRAAPSTETKDIFLNQSCLDNLFGGASLASICTMKVARSAFLGKGYKGYTFMAIERRPATGRVEA